MELSFAADASRPRAAVVNENEVRAAAGLTMVIGAVAFAYAYFAKQYVPLQVAASLFFAEFLIRVTAGLRYSPIGVLARAMTLGRAPEWVSAKPKRFAWTLGLAMALAMTVITNSGIRGPLPRTHVPDLPDADVDGIGARAVPRLQDLRPADRGAGGSAPTPRSRCAPTAAARANPNRCRHSAATRGRRHRVRRAQRRAGARRVARVRRRRRRPRRRRVGSAAAVLVGRARSSRASGRCRRSGVARTARPAGQASSILAPTAFNFERVARPAARRATRGGHCHDAVSVASGAGAVARSRSAAIGRRAARGTWTNPQVLRESQLACSSRCGFTDSASHSTWWTGTVRPRRRSARSSGTDSVPLFDRSCSFRSKPGLSAGGASVLRCRWRRSTRKGIEHAWFVGVATVGGRGLPVLERTRSSRSTATSTGRTEAPEVTRSRDPGSDHGERPARRVLFEQPAVHGARQHGRRDDR